MGEVASVRFSGSNQFFFKKKNSYLWSIGPINNRTNLIFNQIPQYCDSSLWQKVFYNGFACFLFIVFLEAEKPQICLERGGEDEKLRLCG